MANPNGDKIQGSKPKVNETEELAVPVEEKVEEVKEEPVAPVQPRTNFATTLNELERENKTILEANPLYATLKTYLDRFKKAANSHEKASAQEYMFAVLKQISTKGDYNEFKNSWSFLLDFVHDHKDEINALTINQSLNVTRFDPSMTSGYTCLSTIVVLTSDPERRFNILKVDTEDLRLKLSHFGSLTIDNITRFYRLG